MAREKIEDNKVISSAHELSQETEYKFVRELPKCIDALAKYRRNEEKRVPHDAEIIPLDKRQDLLRAIFEANHKPLDKTEHIDVYNPAVIVGPNGVEFLGRAEGRKTPYSTLVIHFLFEDGAWTPQGNIAPPLEDPAVAKIGNEIVVAGVKLERDIRTASAEFKTVFYKGSTLDDLKKLGEESPLGMKDVRFTELKVLKKGIAVYTRP